MNEIVEFGRRLKRSLDGSITYRKATIILILVLVFFFYLGPGLARWLTGRGERRGETGLQACVADRLAQLHSLLETGNGHTDLDHLSYVGNGYIGLSVTPDSQINIKSKRTLSIPVPFKPLVSVRVVGGEVSSDGVQVTDYQAGTVTELTCLAGRREEDFVTVTSTVYAHRTVAGVLVQDIKIYNPNSHTVQLAINSLGISGWEDAVRTSRTVEQDEYNIVTGTLRLGNDKKVVAVVSKNLPATVEVNSRMAFSLHLMTGVAYSDVDTREELARDNMQKEALRSISNAASMSWQRLTEAHSEVWAQLWTSGFGISHSYAENAVNGGRVNATIYYVLSHSPSLLESNTQLKGFLSYTEGCYSGIRTLQARNLWTSLATLTDVDTVVSYWLLNLEKNGCHNLVKAGADGVMQAIILSLPGLKFSNHHLELNVHPKELHRDLTLRRVNYGNETHINISIHVMSDNKAAIFVSLDKRNRDYYACDAGCLDPPVKLGPDVSQFPVKLTEPVTAILYITADHEHMNELKHTIHVVEVGEAPAHEQHVLELHRTGTRLGGLHPFFWFTIAAIIILFHLFLFRLIYNEYCGTDKYRFRS